MNRLVFHVWHQHFLSSADSIYQLDRCRSKEFKALCEIETFEEEVEEFMTVFILRSSFHIKSHRRLIQDICSFTSVILIFEFDI